MPVMTADELRAEFMRRGWSVHMTGNRWMVPDPFVEIVRWTPRPERNLLRRLAALNEEEIRDDIQGLCCFCREGWEDVPGPRGGKPQRLHTNKHADDCILLEARRLLGEPR